MATIYNYTNKTGTLIGNYVKNIKNIMFYALYDISVNDAATAATQLAKSYQMPVVVKFHNTEINVPYQNFQTPGVQDIVNAYYYGVSR